MKHIAFILSLCLFLACPLLAAHAGESIAYKDGDTELEGYWAPSTCKSDGPAPLVLVVHQWKGLGDYEKGRADMLAAKCYNAFAVDMYGKGIRPANNDDAGKQAGIYKNDPVLARKRITAGLDFAKTRPGIDPAKIAVIGYCFGGGMALELARSGADVEGVISFHGVLTSKDPVTKPGVIKASIQIHHGADDPFVPHDDVHTFVKEMNTADADWELTQYAHAVHSFTEKDAGNDNSKGAAYNEKADKRSWQSALDFLQEIFTKA